MWSTRHADLRCSDFLDIEGSAAFKEKWKSLENTPAATFCGYDGNNNLYLATLNRPTDRQGTIWSFTGNGELRWSVNSLKPSLSSLAVTHDGCVYFDDGEHLVNLDSSGNELWRICTHSETAAVIFLASGHLFVQDVEGKISLYTQDGNLLLDRAAVECSQMNQGCGHGHMPGRLGRFIYQKAVEHIGISPHYSRRMVERFVGVGISAKHVPAVVPETNRVIVVTAAEDQKSCVYGLDVIIDDQSASVKTGFTTMISGGCDTSPAISFDGKHIYSSDAQGRCYCLDTRTGELLWQLQLPNTSSASPSTSPDGMIYFSVKTCVVAIKDCETHGKIVWQQDFSTIESKESDVSRVANSVLAITRRYVYSTVSLGKKRFSQILPSASYLVTLDRSSGLIVNLAPLEHESLCTLSILPDGSVLVPSKPLLFGLAGWLKSIKSRLTFRTPNVPSFYGLVLLCPDNGISTVDGEGLANLVDSID